jgi:uncharacterized integral membrane protein
MRSLLFIAYMTALIYSALRWEWVSYAALGAFILGGVLVVFLSIYRHFRVGGWF